MNELCQKCNLSRLMLKEHKLKVHKHIWNRAHAESWELDERSGRQSSELGPSPSFTTSMLCGWVNHLPNLILIFSYMSG